MKRHLLLVSLVLAAALPLQAADVPGKAEINELAQDSLTAFGQALKDKDFSAFYDDVAEIWKKQTTAEKLMDAFKDMLGPNFDILGIVNELEPTFTPAAEINSDEVLVVKGFYPTKPKRLTFQLKYLEEEGDWKLVGINVKTED